MALKATQQVYYVILESNMELYDAELLKGIVKSANEKHIVLTNNMTFDADTLGKHWLDDKLKIFEEKQDFVDAAESARIARWLQKYFYYVSYVETLPAEKLKRIEQFIKKEIADDDR